MLEIRTNQLKTRKKVLIDDQEYTVRRLGNIEQLDISQFMRRLNQLAGIEKSNKLTETQEREVEEISKKMSDIFVGVFDDGTPDQATSRKLVASLSDTELGLLIEQIFEGDNGTPEVS